MCESGVAVFTSIKPCQPLIVFDQKWMTVENPDCRNVSDPGRGVSAALSGSFTRALIQFSNVSLR